jgi:peptidyl-prolyl cis-trans isomerase SurA
MRSIIALLLILPFLSVAQDDPVLFTVEDNPVHLSEFEYIYNKNNGSGADYSQASLEEYLDLYIKFKLKVQRAKDLKLDTVPSLQRELEGYRRQLANSYLTDKEVSDRLSRELYERMKRDVEVSHILIGLPKNPTKEEVEEARSKAESIKSYIDMGSSFEEMAKAHSEDKNSKNKNGLIGFVSAMLPNGFYELENAIYTLEPGEISEPLRTSVGFHIVKTHGSRPARGKIEAAHILIRKKSKVGPDADAEARIDSVYKLLEAGYKFESLARKFSEDRSSNNKGGNIGIFGINRFEKGFEDTAFGIAEEGEYSKPVETKIGWHIIKLIDRKKLETYERLKRKLQADIAKDDRYSIAQNSMIERIKNDNNFSFDQSVLTAFTDSLSKDFLTYKWKVPGDLVVAHLFKLGDQSFSTRDFAKFLRTNSRSRLRMNNNTPLHEAVSSLFDEYVKNECIKFEEANLEDKYPDFKALMREYEEGIMLFEATKIAVWDRASQDTTGLSAYYEENKENYMWGERAHVESITLTGVDAKTADKIFKKAQGSSLTKLKGKYNKKSEIITHSPALLEKEQFDKIGGIEFTQGAMSELKYNDEDRTATFKKVTSIEAPAIKRMDEARGYIIADYQDHLERIWVEELRSDYDVKVDQKIFRSLYN